MTSNVGPGDGTSSAFQFLHEKVQRWIWRQGWESLREIQERSIPVLLAGDRDLIITAGTASGKTEAAFLPIISRLAGESSPSALGFRAMYVCPLRALINDQFVRMECLCAELDIEVTRWHGDVSTSIKAKARKTPRGVLLITPESLEAILVRHGQLARRMFGVLSYVVIDEMHAFIGSPRGKQLQSLLHRIDVASGSHAIRVGLSATLADERASCAFLRPLAPDAVCILPRSSLGQELKLQLRGYVTPSRGCLSPASGDNEGDAPDDPSQIAIAHHLFDTLRGKRSLVFAGSRKNVENYAVRLADLSKSLGVPEEFFAHHGNLSKEHREDAERRMKDTTRPASIVCTTTLELGIDVGAIESVAQIGPGHTVSGMRQRLGRSGRRLGQAAVMRVYIQEEALSEKSHPLDALRCGTIQTIAMLNLMLQGWNDPIPPGRLDLSTLLHQVLALIAQNGGISASGAWNQLVASGVFADVDQAIFKRLLRRMGNPDVGLIEQAPDGTLLPGPKGEKLIESRDIYAVFSTAEEYRVVTTEGRSVGQTPIDPPVVAGQFMVLGGRRWRVLEVDVHRKEILVSPASGGKPPEFGGELRPPADAVISEMRRVYETVSIPTFLDRSALELLAEARTTFDRLGLRHAAACRHEGVLLLFPWVGERRQQALILALVKAGLEPTPLGLAIGVPSIEEKALLTELKRLAAGEVPEPRELATFVSQKVIEKFDGYLDDDLLNLAFAREHLDTSFLPQLAAEMLRCFLCSLG
ncbi:ATP-dependent Lhr-like helicase [Rhodoblastus acidophilus]|uniref:DEAD/DEAH box helicase n=1 Tax=Rhodoblastus acidophilus TaxID=1074 RepID=UPI0022242027|nr:DEAD/DEAH box helicase [Rhodoblastus acidophilus]MCW2319173.1 ATP-dependent Lhr-like helicase [Rhodoblastus acidophilus]